MDTTLQGQAMQASRPKAKKTAWDVATAAGNKVWDFAAKNSVPGAILICLTLMIPKFLDTIVAEMRASRAEWNKREDVHVGQVKQLAQEFATVTARQSADSKEQFAEMREWSDQNTKLLVEALSRNAQKLDETSKTFRGAAETVKDAAGKIEAATGNVQ